MNYQSNTTDSRKEKGNKQETIRELAKRHMMDQNHTTSDEELRNAIVELDVHISTEYTSTARKTRSIKNTNRSH